MFFKREPSPARRPSSFYLFFLVKVGERVRGRKKIIKFFGRRYYDLLGIGKGGGTSEGPAPEGPAAPPAVGAAPG